MKNIVIALILIAASSIYAADNDVVVEDDEYLPYIYITGIREIAFEDNELVTIDSIAKAWKMFELSKNHLPTIIETEKQLLGDEYFLRSFVEKPKGVSKPTHEVYVIMRYSGKEWRWYRSAYLQSGIALKVEAIDEKVSWSATSHHYVEHLCIKVTERILTENKNGFSIKLFSKRGYTYLITITREQIEKQLDTVYHLIHGTPANPAEEKKDGFID